MKTLVLLCLCLVCNNDITCHALHQLVSKIQLPRLGSAFKGLLKSTKRVDKVLLQDSASYHTWSTEACISKFKVKTEEGLSNEEANRRLDIYGPNALTESTRKSFLKVILEQFEDRLVLVLLSVATLSAILASFEKRIDAFTEPIIIGAILLFNAVMGAMQTFTATNALDALKKLQPSFALVLRSGEWKEIPVASIVPGDIISLRSGDKVPADGRILSSKSRDVRVDESSLTGESNTVSKDSAPVVSDSNEFIGKTNMIFSGTMVTEGSCLYVVTQTGHFTEIGKINHGIVAAENSQQKTPLMENIESFSNYLYKVVVAVSAAVWIINIPKFGGPLFSPSWNKGAMRYMKVAIALGVAAVPEGLPAIISMTLAIGTSKMAKRNVIIRKLSSVETLGCTSVICTDKTGTLTTNKMTVKKIVSLQQNNDKIVVFERDVDGNSNDPNNNGVKDFQWNEYNHEYFQKFATICALCNNADITFDLENNIYNHVGEPTEAALKVLVEKFGIPQESDGNYSDVANKEVLCNNYWKKPLRFISEFEFSRDRKLMSVLYHDPMLHKNLTFTKGAAEVIISRCKNILLENGHVVPMTSNVRNNLIQSFQRMAGLSQRCLGLAFKESNEGLCDENGIPCSQADALEQDMVFIGLCGIMDPPRPEVNQAFELCHGAGVRVIMITGDSKETAMAIAKAVGIFSSNGTDVSQYAFSGNEFFQLAPEKQFEVLKTKRNLIFCRTEPQHKQTLVRLLAQSGQVIAMTGDGVNDAPALQQADIGIAMGITGTEVSKNAADMVLADDNFSSIVSAIEEGRSIYNNMQAFISFLISSSFGEMLSIFLAAMLGLPDILTPLHLLWVNLVTDGPPAIALGFNPPADGIMQKVPRPRSEPLFNKALIWRSAASGAYAALATLGVFLWWFYDRGFTIGNVMRWHKCNVAHEEQNAFCKLFSSSSSHPQTMSLSVLVLIEMLRALSSVSLEKSILAFPPWKNPLLVIGTIIPMLVHLLFMYRPKLSSLLNIVPLSLREWKVITLFAAPMLVVDEVLKLHSSRYK